MTEQTPPDAPGPKRQPIFNPKAFEAAPVIALVLAMIGLQLWIDYAGIPAANALYGDYAFVSSAFWQGERLITMLSYAMLHGGWMHLGFNAVAFFVLGSACWTHMGTARFFAFFAITAIAGAILFAAFRPSENAALVGASGVIFGLIAAVKRIEYRVRSLRGQDTRIAILRFIGIIIAVNVAIGMIPLDDGSGFAGQSVAWEAHIGGFLIGWIITPWLVKFWPQ